MTASDALELLRAAERRGDAVTLVRADGADVIVVTRRAAPERLTLAAAATLAGCSERVLRRAIRGGELPAAGSQRTLTIARADLLAWVEARPARVRARPESENFDAAEMDRRMGAQ